MPRIERQTIHSHGPIVTESFQVFLSGVVTALAQALQFPEPELVNVAAPRLNVVRYASGSHPAFAQADCAERLDPELVLCQPSPTFSSIEAHRFPLFVHGPRLPVS
jgi:hypothetical protein